MTSAALIVLAATSGCANLAQPESVRSDVDVPTIRPPTLDRVIGVEEWAKARHFRGEFAIADGTKAAGVFPYSAAIGKDDRYVYLAVAIDAGENPYNVHGKMFTTYADILIVFLANGSAIELSDGADAKVSQNHGGGRSTADDYHWNGAAWASQTQFIEGEFNDGQPTGGFWAMGAYVGRNMTWEMTLPRDSPYEDVDPVSFSDGGSFRMALGFYRSGDPERHTPRDMSHDVDPAIGYTPEGDLDPAVWRVFTI